MRQLRYDTSKLLDVTGTAGNGLTAIFEAYQFLNLQVTSVGYPQLRTTKVTHPWDFHATIGER
eukprot:9026647-Prorocentrum_lima.AAC.1